MERESIRGLKDRQAEIVQQLRTVEAGQRDALLVELVGSMYPSLLAQALKLTNDYQAAEDAVGESIYKLLRRVDTSIAAESVFAWMRTVVRNTCIDLVRGRRVDLVEDWETIPLPRVAEQGPDECQLAADTSSEVWAVLDTVPEVYRELLLAHHVEGLSIAELVTRFGTEGKDPSRSMSAKLTRAHRAFARAMAASQLPPEQQIYVDVASERTLPKRVAERLGMPLDEATVVVGIAEAAIDQTLAHWRETRKRAVGYTPYRYRHSRTRLQ